MSKKEESAPVAPETRFNLPVPASALANLEAIGKEFGLAALEGAGQFERAFMLSVGLVKLREALTPALMAHIMPLQGSPLGFLTDRQNERDPQKPKTYPMETVREVLIEAVLRGFMPVGNEFNIIAGRFYGAKAGFARKVKEFPGLTDLDLTISIPRMIGDKGATCTCEANWKLNGAAQSLKRDFAVRVNAMMGADAVVGKATRKMLAAIHGKLTGSEFTVPEGEVGEEVAAATAKDVTPRPEVTVDDLIPTPSGDAPAPAEGAPADAQIAAEEAHRQAMAQAELAADPPKGASPQEPRFMTPGEIRALELQAEKASVPTDRLPAIVREVLPEADYPSAVPAGHNEELVRAIRRAAGAAKK